MDSETLEIEKFRNKRKQEFALDGTFSLEGFPYFLLGKEMDYFELERQRMRKIERYLKSPLFNKNEK